ncbi:MAG TPA: biopolymer transporter ExbD [Gemmatimonadaceae bacterium]|jgi:biopolymer transport protein ExbD|nr:biopolymer transporter ExbD [Gemmatimonadaceae bacterium]
MHFEPNVTPFLDVLLVLLILFMFLTVNQRKAIQTHLPDPTGAASDTPPIVLEVEPNAAYTINAQAVRGDQLETRLREIYAGRPTKTIMVRGGPGVTFQDVVTAVDVAKGAGVVAIGLAPRQRATSPSRR